MYARQDATGHFSSFHGCEDTRGMAAKKYSELGSFLIKLDDATVIKHLRAIGPQTREAWNDFFGIIDCDCEWEEIGCDCTEPCECEREFKACPHFLAQEMQFSWPVLVELGRLLSPDPQKPSAPSEVLVNEFMVGVMAKRFEHGEHLYHPGDSIQIGASERIERIEEQLVRFVTRRPNGTDVIAEIEDCDLPDEDPYLDADDEWQADLAASRLQIISDFHKLAETPS